MLMKQVVRRLFDYESSYFLDYGRFIFTNATLKKDMGKFKAGDKIPEIHLIGTRLNLREDIYNHMYDNSEDVNIPLVLDIP